MTDARFRYGGVFAITVAMTVFVLIAGDSRLARAIEVFAAGTALLIAVATSGATVRTRRIAGAAVGIAVATVLLASATGVSAPTVPLAATSLLLALSVGVISSGLLRLILHRGVDVTAVLGALSVYLLIGLTFAFLVGAIATGFSGPYFAEGIDGTQADRVYFSFTALTTTGFGDLTARTRGGHALAVLEMLIGQLYLVTVIALLVSNLRHDRVDAPSPARGDARSPRDGDALRGGHVELRDPHSWTGQ